MKPNKMSLLKSLSKSFLVLMCLGIFCPSFAQKKASNIAIIMPFCSKKILANPNCYDAQLGNLCREYYQGVLIALDSFERAHIAVAVNVFDTDNDSLTTLSILQKQQVKETELIIGPVLQGGNKMMTNFVKGKGIYHVSPLMTFSTTKLVDGFWISANPDLPSYANFLYEYIVTQHHDSANIIIVSDKSSLDKNISTAFKKIIPTSKTVKIKIVDYVKGINVTNYLSSTLSNHVIIPSSKEAIVNAIFRSIKDTSNLSCYGFSQWLDFKNTDYNVWQQMNTHIATPYFVNYDNEQVKNFISNYRERFYTEPTEAAFKGYDQMILFGKALAEEGKSFIKKLEGKTYPMLHTNYNFKRQKEGESYQNYYLNIIKLEELKMKRVN